MIIEVKTLSREMVKEMAETAFKKALVERNKDLENGPYLAVPGIVLLEGGLPILTKTGGHIAIIESDL